MTDLRQLAKEREKLHENHASSRPLSKDYEYIGVATEAAFADEFDLQIDETSRPQGDGGKDFIATLTIDVKGARKPYNLLVEQGKSHAHVYVLGRYDDTIQTISEWVGWEWGYVVRRAPTRDVGGYGIISHYIPAGALRPISELRAILKENTRAPAR